MMQIAGFAAVFALFLACGLAFSSLTASSQALQGFQAMYYISSFFAQFVNATTFLLVSCKKCRSFIVQSCISPALVMPIACISPLISLHVGLSDDLQPQHQVLCMG